MRRAFTIVELLVTIAITCILISFIGPPLLKMRNAGLAVQCTANLKTHISATHLYYDIYHKIPIPSTYTMNVPAGEIDLYNRLVPYVLEVPPPTEVIHTNPWSCPGDKVKQPLYGNSYYYFPWSIALVVDQSNRKKNVEAIFMNNTLTPVAFDSGIQHGGKINLGRFDGSTTIVESFRFVME